MKDDFVGKPKKYGSIFSLKSNTSAAHVSDIIFYKFPRTSSTGTAVRYPFKKSTDINKKSFKFELG